MDGFELNSGRNQPQPMENHVCHIEFDHPTIQPLYQGAGMLGERKAESSLAPKAVERKVVSLIQAEGEDFSVLHRSPDDREFSSGDCICSLNFPR